MLTLQRPANPVDIYGNKTFSLEKLHEFYLAVDANFSATQMEIYRLETEMLDTRLQNVRMAQLLNWIAVTNPQILDEFQTTAAAFEQLVPRNRTGEDESCVAS
jgi:hypothetical protein